MKGNAKASCGGEAIGACHRGNVSKGLSVRSNRPTVSDVPVLVCE